MRRAWFYYQRADTGRVIYGVCYDDWPTETGRPMAAVAKFEIEKGTDNRYLFPNYMNERDPQPNFGRLQHAFPSPVPVSPPAPFTPTNVEPATNGNSRGPSFEQPRENAPLGAFGLW